MKKTIIFLVSFYFVIVALSIVFDFNFDIKAYLQYISSHLKSIDINGVIRTLKKFPDFSGGFLDDIKAIFECLKYPVNVLVSIVKVVVNFLENCFIILYGLTGGVFS